MGLIANSIIFTLLAFYVSSVRGSEDEHALSVFFIFDRDYWFPPDSVITGDDGDILRREQNLAAAFGDIRTRKLTKSYNTGNTALKEVTIRFQKGEVRSHYYAVAEICRHTVLTRDIAVLRPSRPKRSRKDDPDQCLNRRDEPFPRRRLHRQVRKHFEKHEQHPEEDRGLSAGGSHIR